MRQVIRPAPERSIDVGRFGAGRKASNENASHVPSHEPPRKRPSGWNMPARGEIFPRTGELRLGDAEAITLARISEVDHVLAVDLIGAQGHGLGFEGKALLCFKPRGLRAARRVERRNTFRVEPTAVDRGPLAGGWLKGPAGMMRAVDLPPQSHA